jgi:hypothetical protein
LARLSGRPGRPGPVCPVWANQCWSARRRWQADCSLRRRASGASLCQRTVQNPCWMARARLLGRGGRRRFAGWRAGEAVHRGSSVDDIRAASTANGFLIPAVLAPAKSARPSGVQPEASAAATDGTRLGRCAAVSRHQGEPRPYGQPRSRASKACYDPRSEARDWIAWNQRSYRDHGFVLWIMNCVAAASSLVIAA